MTDSPAKQASGLLFWLLVTAAAAALGSVASTQARAFYAELIRPAWAPPGWLFGPAWATLYILMAIAAWLVWRERRSQTTALPLTLYVTQLAANALWSWLFFAWRLGMASFADIVLLLALIVAALVTFWRIRPLAGALLLPYLAWVAFASVLNYATWQLNRSLLS